MTSHARSGIAMCISQTVNFRRIILVGLLTMLMVLATAWSASAQSSELPPGGTFWDDDGSVHEGMIEAIVAAGITQGCTEDGRYYCPGTPVTRGQMATFLTRALDLAPADRDYFPDDDGSVHEDSINRIAAAEITSGRPDGTFGPDDPVTREQMATFLAIALDLPAASDNRFDDVSGIHESNVNRVAQAEITVGCNSEGTLFCPRDHVTRGQMATFLGRALSLAPTQPSPRALTEGVRTVERYMGAIVTPNYRSGQNLSTGVARSYLDYLVMYTQIDGTFDQDDAYSVTSANSTATSLGDRRWRLNLVLDWTSVGPDWSEERELRDFVVVQQADGTFRVESFRRDGLPLSSYVRTGRIASTPSGQVTARLVAQFRRADLSRPDIINIVEVTNHRNDWIGIDDSHVMYTSESDNQLYISDVGLFPSVRPGQTMQVMLGAWEVRAPHSAADLFVMSYGPDPSGYEYEQLLGFRVPAWPR